jgi:hypothetical protein
MQIQMESIFSTKQIKLFNKIYQEFLDGYAVATETPPSTFKVKKAQVLLQYLMDCGKDLDNFLDCKESALDNINLFKQSQIDITKTKINWEYLHNLFFIVYKDVKPDILEKSKKGIINSKTSTKMVKDSASDNIFGDLIKEMSSDIQGTLEGKDLSTINPMELLSGLMNKDNKGKVGGIDFSEIINKTVISLQSKIDNKEIDIEKLKETANTIANSFGMQTDKGGEVDVEKIKKTASAITGSSRSVDEASKFDIEKIQQIANEISDSSKNQKQ